MILAPSQLLKVTNYLWATVATKLVCATHVDGQHSHVITSHVGKILLYFKSALAKKR